jgi:phosphatidylglycerol:prolipoprotein diacylglycerol transferase
MAQTLFYIPATFAGLPVFGFGLLVLAVFVIGGAAILWQARNGWTAEANSTAVLILALAAGAYFVLPRMVEHDIEGRPLGVPIRGFGVMMMLATIAGVGISAWRARQVGLDPEIIYSLAFYMFIGGILGARGFYVIQYWEQYFKPGMSLAESLKAIVNAASGGLVVYGSFLGGTAAGAWFVYQRQLPLLALADIIAPGMALGQAIGRIGCFLNGCCYGGLCTLPLIATPFPQTSNPATLDLSPPYARQKELGWIYGFELAVQRLPDQPSQFLVTKVEPNSPAANAGLHVGDEVKAINGFRLESAEGLRRQMLAAKWDPRKLPETLLDGARALLQAAGSNISLQTADGRTIEWTIGELPAWSLPIHPTQLYACLDAALLAFFLWNYFPFRRRDGEVFALLITLHPISRFLLELIRMDEPGQFGSSLTISQWLSIALLAAAAAFWLYVERRPRKLAFSPQ